MTALRVRMRPDLDIEPQGEAGERCWIARDPVALRYFRLRDEEYFVLKLLDGRTSLEEIREKFEAAFQPLQLGMQQLHAFILRLHEQGLILSEASGQGTILHRRAEKTLGKQTTAAWSNPLAIRVPGIAGAPLVDFLYPRLKSLFSPMFLAVAALFIIGTAAAVLLEFDSFRQRLAHTQNIFVPQTMLWMMLVLIVVKALHELGHALVCRHFGATCHEIGMMLLVGSPTLYCDVTDSWRLPSKWQRILISSAGMLVELVLAAIATIVWWRSDAGLVSLLAAQTMFVCSVGTLGFNLNPLLRCDGYYILSDWLEVPNLWQDSRGLLQRKVYHWLFGLDLGEDATLPAKWQPWLLAYAAGSIVYSVLLTITILTFLFQILEPHGLGGLVWLAGAIVFGGMGKRAITPLWRSWSQPNRRSVRRGRTSLVVIAAISLLVAIVFLPLPSTIRAKVWIDPDQARGVYVPLAGTLEEIIPPGTQVSKDDVIARLTNVALEVQLAEAAALTKQHAARVDNLKLLMNDDPTQAPLLPAAIKTLEDQQQRLAHFEREAERLTLRAPIAGVVQPPAVIPANSDEQRLFGWSGSLFESRNHGCLLESGTLVCHIGPEGEFTALVLVAPEDAVDLARGQTVRITCDSLPGTILTGSVDEIAESNDDDLSPEIALALQLPRENTPGQKLAAEHHLARVKLTGDVSALRTGMTGTARIAATWEPLLPRLWRYATRAWH